MTREEEMKIAIFKENQRNQAIEQAAYQNTLEKNQGHYYTDWYFGFINGAQWADEHPKDNLVDIDKVCEWLEENANKFVCTKPYPYNVTASNTSPLYCGYANKALVDNLKKAIKEEWQNK